MGRRLGAEPGEWEERSLLKRDFLGTFFFKCLEALSASDLAAKYSITAWQKGGRKGQNKGQNKGQKRTV